MRARLILQTAEILDTLDQRNAIFEGEIEQQVDALRATKLETRRCPACDAQLKLGVDTALSAELKSKILVVGAGISYLKAMSNVRFVVR